MYHCILLHVHLSKEHLICAFDFQRLKISFSYDLAQVYTRINIWINAFEKSFD